MTSMTEKNTIIDPDYARSLAELSLKSSDAASQDIDLFGIMWMEHINLTVGSREIATIFYMERTRELRIIFLFGAWLYPRESMKGESNQGEHFLH